MIKFLLVDDIEANLLALEGLLKRPGLEMLKARSGAEALEMLLAHDAALALIDVHMPEMDGFELARLMRGTERTRQVPIIFITAGAADRQRRFDGYDLGAVDFLFKPVEPHVLQSKANVFFDLARQREMLWESEQRSRATSAQLEQTVAELQKARQEALRIMDALRKSLQEKEVLLREIHHRVKNNMQVISSLVSLQAKALEEKNSSLAGRSSVESHPTAAPHEETVLQAASNAFADVRNRVHSMALVHEKLYESENLAAVNFATYAESLLNDLWHLHRLHVPVTLSLAIEPLFLTLETAVPCGLIPNELVANALKHAFAGRSEGMVRVSARSGLGGRVTLGVSDDGTGLPCGLDVRETSSLGLRLVQMLSRQLHATVQTRSDSCGTEFTIEFDLPSQEDGSGRETAGAAFGGKS